MNFTEEIARRRTFGIISHPDAGKTTLTEKLLLFGGAIQEAGAVKSHKIKKSATSDFMEIEKQRGISVATSVLAFNYQGIKINILDTPGHKDFAEDTFRTLTAVDSVIVVIDVAKGVEEQTEKLVEVCRMREIPIIVFINKLDREGKDGFDLLDELEKKLNFKVCPLSFPIGMGYDFQGVYNLWEQNLMLFEEENKQKIAKWWEQIQKWRTKNSLDFKNSDVTIKPQHAVQRLYELTKNKDTYVTTEVGQHQVWAAQHYKFNKPNRWMTSGGLGTMGYGLPAAVGVQIAHPEKLVIDIAGEASVLMTMQEMSTAVQYNLPIKIFILNNQYMGMVRQWQELLHEKNYSESYSEALPDFMKMAEAYGCKGIKADSPDELDDKIQEMIDFDGPVIFDCHVDPNENCFPMIPSGKPHNQMILGPNDQEENKIKGKGKALV